MNPNRKTIFFSLAIVVMGACTVIPHDNYFGLASSNNAIRLTPFITKVTEASFETGDAIGLSIIRESGTYASNEMLTYDGTAFSGSLNWYSDGTDVATLKAYYPYCEEFPTSFTVASDQTGGIASSDFVSSVKTDVAPTADAIPMIFKHQFCRLSITTVNRTDDEISGVAIKGAKTTAIIADDLTATVDDASSAVDIDAYKDGNNYYVIIPPQKVTLTASVSFGGKVLSDQMAEATLTAGNQYSITIVVTEEQIKVLLSGEVDNWNPGGDIPTTNTIYYGFGSSAQDVYDNALDENNPNAVSAKYRTTTSNSPAGSYTATNSTGDGSYLYFLVPSNMNDPTSFKLDDGIGDFFSDIAMVKGHNTTIDITLPASYPYEEAVQTLGGQSYKVWKESGKERSGSVLPFVVQ